MKIEVFVAMLQRAANATYHVILSGLKCTFRGVPAKVVKISTLKEIYQLVVQFTLYLKGKEHFRKTI